VIPHDAKLITVSVAVMVVYVSAFLGRLHLRHSKVLLGFIGVLAVILSLAYGIGICGYFGARFSEIIVGVPFIVVGIGVDDMFIIVNAFDRSNRRKLPLVERMTETMAEIGASITMTSLTSVYAFYIGANANLPSMQGFCIFAGTCLLMCYILQILLFSPLVVLDARRHEQNRIDCFPCARWSTPASSGFNEEVPAVPVAGEDASNVSLDEIQRKSPQDDGEISWADKFVIPKLVPLLFKRPVKLGVVRYGTSF
jgi:Niemann-Pick C1 protein